MLAPSAPLRPSSQRLGPLPRDEVKPVDSTERHPRPRSRRTIRDVRVRHLARPDPHGRAERDRGSHRPCRRRNERPSRSRPGRIPARQLQRLGTNPSTRATNSSWQPAAVTAAACALTGLRVGLHWELPAILVFTLGLGVLAMSDVYWRALPKRIVYATWAGGLAGLATSRRARRPVVGLRHRRRSRPHSFCRARCPASCRPLITRVRGRSPRRTGRQRPGLVGSRHRPSRIRRRTSYWLAWSPSR